MNLESPALVVVDMQRYYLETDSTFARFHSHHDPGCLDYIHRRCATEVIPNIKLLVPCFRQNGWPTLYLRLCGQAEDRSDLQPTFARVHREAHQLGFPGLYPLQSDPHSEVISGLGAASDQAQTFCKTTYSAFTSAPLFEAYLQKHALRTLLFTGLATSQCVETTARDAADRGYRILHIEDAQADYSEITHRASLYSSQGVCGGHIVDTQSILRHTSQRS